MSQGNKRSMILVSVWIVLLVSLGGVSAWGYERYLMPKPKSTSSATTQQQSTQSKQATTTGFDKTKYSTTDPASLWVVVNKQHPLNPIDYTPPDLTSIGNGQQMRAEAASSLKSMFADATAAGFSLVADSGYRSYDLQVTTYNSIAKSYGTTYADTVSAHPGYSEHQTGWAVDIGTSSCHVGDCFADTPGGKWATANAYKYGFILRYPESLTNITGYSNEAWHFRYIGTALSTEMHNQNVQTLEQFFNIKGGTTYK